MGLVILLSHPLGDIRIGGNRKTGLHDRHFDLPDGLLQKW
jgi:hypothetical protein